MADYSDWRYIFTSPWDPVTGEIPGDWTGSEGIIPDDPLDQLGAIIERSRRILRLDYLRDPDDPAFTRNTKALSPAEQLEIQEEIHQAAADIAENGLRITPGYIKLVRYIFGSSRSIYQYRDNYKYGPGFTFNSYIDKVVKSARDVAPSETPTFVILAVLALNYAYTEAKYLVLHEEQPRLPVAWALLHAAEQAKDQEMIRELQPLAEREKRVHEGRLKGRDSTKEKAEPQRKKCLALAKEIIMKHPRWSCNRVTKDIAGKTSIPKSTVERYLGWRK